MRIPQSPRGNGPKGSGATRLTRQTMNELKTYQTYAKSLLTDIQAVAKNGLPRQEVILDWLDEFLLRSKKRGFQMGQPDVDDLTALDLFVRVNKIPATVRAPLE
jgi:hypothetical protein